MSRSKAMGGREPLIHLAVLGVSIVAAATLWTREKEPKALAQGDVVVWSGRSADVERIVFENKTRKVTLEAKKDAVGRYFVGTSEKDAAPPSPHRGDAGAPPEAPPGGRATVGFVSVTAGDKVADALAPLKAMRALGRVGADRAADFGLGETDASLTVRVGGTERKLLIGNPTPGGGDRYVKDAASGEAFVLKGDSIRNLEGADTLMVERDLHEWKEAEVVSAKITAGGKSREIVRGGPEGKRFWADPANRDANDETLGNWMSKLDKLRPAEFQVNPPEGRATVLRIDYTGNRQLGFVELVKVSVADKKPEYLIQTERTRLYAKVQASLAEQIEQDVGNLVK